MKAKAHFTLLAQAVLVWATFWLAGWPSYYQQYPPIGLGVACAVLSSLIALMAVYVLVRGRPQTRLRRAVWIAFYYTVPFAILDALYCGLYLGYGVAFLQQYWYLTVFYITPWLTFPPIAWLLQARE